MRPVTQECERYHSVHERPVVIFSILACAAFCVRIACFTGLIGSDDLGYSTFAEQIALGTYHLVPHHYAIRYGILLPVAALYKLFGVSEWTTVAIPLIASSLSPAFYSLIAYILSGTNAAWICGAMLATFPIEVRYASILVPEPILNCILGGAVLLALYAERRRYNWMAFVSGCMFGAAYITKEPGIFVGAAAVIYLLFRREWGFAASMCCGIAGIVALETAWYLVSAGDPLFRVHAMGVHNASEMAIEANQELWYRLLKAYPKIALIPDTHFGLHSITALVLCSLALLRRDVQTMLSLCALVPFLYLNFGTSSFTHFWALPVAPRYISCVILFLIVWASIRLTTMEARRYVQALCVGGCCVVGIYCSWKMHKTAYRVSLVRQIRQSARQTCSSSNDIERHLSHIFSPYCPPSGWDEDIERASNEPAY